MHHAFDILIALLAAHVTGDFVLQSRRDVARKHRPDVMFRHVLVHAVLAYFLVGLWAALWIPAAVLATHWAIDWYKVRFGEPTFAWFVGDQIAHISILVVIAFTAGAVSASPAWTELAPDLIFPAMALYAGFVLTVRVGSLSVGLLLSPFLAEMQAREGDEAMPWRRGFEEGGRIIGYLERTLLFVFAVAGQLSAIGFLVAAKAFFRIGEIKDAENRLEAEYIIIGTLASFAHGILLAYVTVLLLHLR